MTDITAKLAEALAEMVGYAERGSLPKDFATTRARDALTAYTASQSTPDEETVERVAYRFDHALNVALVAEALLKGFWFSDEKQAVRAARAALSAMPRDEAALADLTLDYLHLAQPEFCSARCPSVGREGEPIPHLPECVSMRSLLDRLPFATPGATISTGLMAKLKKLANYLTEQGEYEACDLIDTVVDRLSASPPTPARDDGWMPIETAPKDGTRILALFHADIYPRIRPQREDLEGWNGAQAVVRHPGTYELDGRTWDHGWNIAGPVGVGGLPDEWFAGWRPLSAPPAPAQEPRS